MKKMLADFDTPSLPEEIIANILKRIPVKSLIRFQCVCKQWKNLLKTPYFIADHLGHSVHDNPSSLLLQPNHGADPFKLCLLDNKKRVREYQNPPLIDSLKCARIIGSSNGLLCVEFDEFGMSPPSLLLWNPAIREVRQIPRTLNDFKGDCILGFGSSPIANDYKIVRAYYEFGLVVNRVKVYSLNTGSWKELEFENLEGVLLFQETVTANGTIFWYGSKDLDLIVSFDIAKEVFRLIPMHNAGTMLTVYENKLAVLFDTMLGDFQNCLTQLWVMEDGTGASKARWIWTKKFSTFRCP